MKFCHRFILFIYLVALPCLAQPPVAESEKFAQLITKAELKENLSILASDAMEGRLTGSRGQKMAATFIQHHFQQLGLLAPVNGSHFQEFNLHTVQHGPASLHVGNRVFQNFSEIVYSGNWSGSKTTEVIFVGKGEPLDLKQVDVKDKAVLVWWSGFSFSPSQSALQILKNAGAKLILLYPDRNENDFSSYAHQLAALAEEEEYTLEKPRLESEETSIVFVNAQVAEEIIGDLKKMKSQVNGKRHTYLKNLKPGVITFKSESSVRSLQTENVLGLLEGTDKKDEWLVITAHYDHIGMGKMGNDKINNGADDDGSGTVAVLQLAKAFAEAKKQGHGPRRSILFMTFTAEEWGLYGSEYYTDHPIQPLSSTVANLNIDMIGRFDEQHKSEPNYVYIIGSDKLSSELHEINERNNTSLTQLVFDYTYNDIHHPANLYQRSDHWNFARYQVPIIFYFDGLHEDYHQPTDETDKIEFDLLEKRTKCIFHTAWEIANRENRLKKDK